MNKFVLNSAESYPIRNRFKSETSTKWFSVFRVFDSAKSFIPEASSPDEFLDIVDTFPDIVDEVDIVFDSVDSSMHDSASDTGTSPWKVL